MTSPFLTDKRRKKKKREEAEVGRITKHTGAERRWASTALAKKAEEEKVDGKLELGH